MGPRRIGELLVSEGYLSEAAIQRALGYQRLSGERIKLGSILLNWDLLAEEELLAALAKLHRCDAVAWATLQTIPMETVRLLPSAQAVRLSAIPWAAEKGLIRVAFADPGNLSAIDEVAALTGRRVQAGVTTEARLLQSHQKYYGRHLPLEYRGILQKLERRTTTTTLVHRDFRSPDVTAAERIPGAAPRPTGASAAGDALYFGADPSVAIPVDGDPAGYAPAPQVSRENGSVVDLPEFPDIPAAVEAEPAESLSPGPSSTSSATSERGSSPLDSADDSLTDWVGRALASFTGEAAPKADPGSAGVADPSLFGRETTGPLPDPGARPISRDEMDPTLSEAHTRGVPSSIPPFRRASDPAGMQQTGGVPTSVPPFRRQTDPKIPIERAPPPSSPSMRDDEAVAAGMWRPGPEDEEPARLEPAIEAPVSDAIAGRAARSRDEIADSILQDSLVGIPRVLLLGAGRGGVTGWRSRGGGLSPEAVAEIRIPASEISVFSAVQESGIPHFGAVDGSEWPRGMAALLGSAAPDCAIFPIRILDGVAAFLYADRLGMPMQYEDFAVVARAAASAANVLSRFLLRADGSRPQVLR